MARVERVELIDDLDGSSADRSVRFAFDGTDYEIDLSEPNAARFADELAPWIASARKTRARRRSGASDTPKIRAWAIQNGYAVSDRGMIPAGIVADYRAAH